MMYNYARSIGRIKEDAPFIDFNCADYFNNPQLLIGRLKSNVQLVCAQGFGQYES
ncbi:transcriptional regulator [Sporolactobacillus vineae]|nr:transcriptional regulator [Sporolactobacillus vineae]